MTKDNNSKVVIPAPIAKKVPQVTVLHGATLVDNYAWMRDDNFRTGSVTDPDLMPHLQAENAHADSYMADTDELQQRIYQEMRGRIKEDSSSVPVRRGRFEYYVRTEVGKQYSLVCRRKVQSGRAKPAAEEVLINVDSLAEGKEFFSLGSWSVSPSGNFLAYTYDDVGFRQYKLVVKNLLTGKILSSTAERVTSIAWAADNKTILYSTEDAVTKRSNCVYRHKVGQVAHTLVFEEKDEFFRVGLSRSRSGKYFYLSVGSHTTQTVRYLPTNKPDGKFKEILPRQHMVRYEVQDDGKNFYILTNEDAVDFRLIKCPIKSPGKDNWQEVIAHRPGVMLVDVDVFKTHLVVLERDNGLVKVRILLDDEEVTGASGARDFYVDFPEPIYEVSAGSNHEFDSRSYQLSYQSMVSPPSTLSYNVDSQSLETLKVVEVVGYDSSQYETVRLFATAADGTRVPMSVVYKKGIKLDGKNPCHLYGYGSYGIGMPASFSSARLSLLNRGYVYVIAHIRGGNELGETWRADGKLKKKMNTFTDFIACADHLIASGYTSSDLLSMEGGSAGGLLMGAVLNLRQGLVKAAIVKVPFVDVINTMLDESLPLTVAEFEEWGNPKVKADYDYIRTYSPYENLQPRDYPAILVKSAFYDSQVMYWEPAKYVARLRDIKTDGNPLLFKILLEAGGHGGKSGRFNALQEAAFDYAFMLKSIGYEGL
ncbi:MAG: S9 family peptidase [Candidatus Obscuribacter sp.]|jgi:oligopeptidase B|nr:S9 family peptidase [Candidatus Obscuribacter sp.]